VEREYFVCGLEGLPYDRRVKVKLSISMTPELGEAVRVAAAEAGMTLSEWLAAAAETKLRQDEDAKILKEAADKRRSRGLGRFLDEWQAEHGAFTEEEMASARRDLGLDGSA
jgi:hypothetical protein